MSKVIFDSELGFENHLREIIDSRIMSKNPYICMLENKAIGDIVIVRDGPSPAIFFLEVKYYKRANNRLGVGAHDGTGIQLEILKKPHVYLESHFRWILGSNTHNVGRYWLITSEKIRKFISGGRIKDDEQNNFRRGLFWKCPSIDENQLVEQLKIWLSV